MGGKLKTYGTFKSLHRLKLTPYKNLQKH